MQRILIVLILLTFAACSSAERSIEKNNDKRQEEKIVSQKKRNAAEQLFISGSVNEMKGNYAEAIIDYQEALKLDPSAGIHFALAKNYYRLNKLNSAMDYAEKAVNLDSTNSEYNHLIASIYKSANHPDSAAIVYERLIAQDSSDTQAYYNLANLYQSNKPLKARELYNKLLDRVGPEWSVLVNLAQLNERLGDVEKTIATVKELVELDPANLRLKKLLIESYIKNEKYNEALNLSDELLRDHPGDIHLMEYRAHALVKSGDWEEGAAQYRKLIENNEVPLESKIKIGAAFLSHTQVDSTSLQKAKDIFTDIERDTSNWQVKLYLAEIALEENDDSLAVNYFKDAAELAPWNSTIYMRLGGLLFDTARYEDAIEILEPAMTRFPDEFALNLILGLSLAQEGENVKAEKYLKKSLSLNPDDFTALYAYGVTLNQLDKGEEALIYLNKALEQDPENTQILGIIGLIYDNLGRHEESIASYEKALSFNEFDPLVLNNYAYALAEQNKNLDKAFEMSEKALELAPDNSSYLDTFGWVQYKLGNYDEAKEYIEKSLLLDADNAEVLDHLGDVYFKLGDKDKAVDYWEKAFEVDPDREGLKQKIEKGEL